MKKSVIYLLFVLSTILVACNKEDIGPKLQKEAEEKIIGKWEVEKTILEEYDPISTLKSNQEKAGTADDYYVFRSTYMVEINASPGAKTEVNFQVLNPFQVWIGDQSWQITELTQTKLLLKRDQNYAAVNKRYLTTIFLKR